jgi:hypothetical protein
MTGKTARRLSSLLACHLSRRVVTDCGEESVTDVLPRGREEGFWTENIIQEVNEINGYRGWPFGDGYLGINPEIFLPQ